MDTTAYIFTYCSFLILAFGIIGNILVVLSILRGKSVLKNNYYFLVLHLAICDLGTMILYIAGSINNHSNLFCLGACLGYLFRVAGIGIMLVISVFRYRATVHPLKPAITRRKMKIVCGLVYSVSFILGYGASVPACFISKGNGVVYKNTLFGYFASCFYFLPSIFMAVVYFKIGRALVKQRKDIKNACSNSASAAPSSPLNTQRFLRNRKAFFVCLITVLCYGVGSLTFSLLFIMDMSGEYNVIKHARFSYLAHIVRVAGCYAVNPLIYGILDKKLLKFWKLCRQRKQLSQSVNKVSG
jgi:hypothetical protein